MEIISSRANPLFKQWLRTAEGKSPVGGGERLLWLEGPHLCEAWWQRFDSGMQVIVDVSRYQQSPALQALVAHFPPTLCAYVDPALFQRLSRVEQHQGIALIAERPKVLNQAIAQRSLLLDRVQDPGNLGTLLRTAAAVGIQHVYLSEGCCDVWSPKVLRSAQGAHLHLQLHEQCNLMQYVDAASVPVLCTALDAQAVSLYEVPLCSNSAWLFGNEGQGVEPALQALCNKRVFIPHLETVESLNVAIAAGVCLFEQYRQVLLK